MRHIVIGVLSGFTKIFHITSFFFFFFFSRHYNP
jgi:hypothetical protein